MSDAGDDADLDKVDSSEGNEKSGILYTDTYTHVCVYFNLLRYNT